MFPWAVARRMPRSWVLKMSRFLQAETDRPQAEGGVRFLFETARNADLVAAHIERADHHLMGIRPSPRHGGRPRNAPPPSAGSTGS